MRVRKSDSVDGLFCVTNFYISKVSFELKIILQSHRMANHHRALMLLNTVEVGDYVESISGFFVSFLRYLFHYFLRGRRYK